MLDYILDVAVHMGWMLFGVYVVVIFIRTVMTYGLVQAVLILFTRRVIVPLLLVIALNLFSLSLVFIQPTNMGVVISLVSPNGIRNQPFNSGLRFIIPLIEQVRIYPIYWQTYTMSSKPMEGNQPGNDAIRARTRDGQEVLLDCSVIFRIDPEQLVRLHIDWQNRYIQDLVRPVIRGLVRTEVSQFNVNEVNSNQRRNLEATLDRELKEELANKGLILDQFILRDITFSAEYAASIERKQVALEDQERANYQAERIERLAQGEAEAIKIKADAQAEAFRLVGEALKVNSELLTHEYIQRISPNIKVMLLPNDTPLILPMPELEENLTLTTTQEISPTVTITSQATVTPTVTPTSTDQ